MFNLSIPDLIVVGAAGLVVFGPKRLPELARSIGESVRELKKAMEGQPESVVPVQTDEEHPCQQERS